MISERIVSLDTVIQALMAVGLLTSGILVSIYNWEDGTKSSTASWWRRISVRWLRAFTCLVVLTIGSVVFAAARESSARTAEADAKSAEEDFRKKISELGDRSLSNFKRELEARIWRAKNLADLGGAIEPVRRFLLGAEPNFRPADIGWDPSRAQTFLRSLREEFDVWEETAWCQLVTRLESEGIQVDGRSVAVKIKVLRECIGVEIARPKRVSIYRNSRLLALLAQSRAICDYIEQECAFAIDALYRKNVKMILASQLDD